MSAPREYGVELQQRATRMALDARKDPASARGAIKRIADQLGVHPEALRNWVRQAEIDGGVQPGTTTDDTTRIAELEREVRELRCANEILDERGFLRCSGARPQDQEGVPTVVVVDYIDAHRDRFGVEPICTVLKDAGVQIARYREHGCPRLAWPASPDRPTARRGLQGLAEDPDPGSGAL